MSRSFRWSIGLTILIAMANGCVSPALFEARTELHSDGRATGRSGSRRRDVAGGGPSASLAVPLEGCGPGKIPPAFAKEHRDSGDRKYFTAQGAPEPGGDSRSFPSRH